MWIRLSAGLLLLLQVGRISAALTPAEVAVIAVRGSQQSRELADHYIKARGIPETQLCLIDCTPGETLGRAEWESKVRPAIRQWLEVHDPDKKIRCLVTVWDVPLKIGPRRASGPTLEEVPRHFAEQRRLRQRLVVDLAADLDKLLPANPGADREAPPAEAPPSEYGTFLEGAFKDSQARLRQFKNKETGDFQRASQLFDTLYLQGVGLGTWLQAGRSHVEGQPEAARNADLARLFEFRRGEFDGLIAAEKALATLPESASRNQQLLGLIEKSSGYMGTLVWIEQQLQHWRKNETYSSFDNELALAWWPEYALLLWHTSFLHYAADPAPRGTNPKTLVVARLEAPTMALAKRLVDRSLIVEREGLEGKFYIDARGMAADKGIGSYGDFDQNLRDLAAWLKEHTNLQVIVDNRERLFQKGECPDAALYCGWYSLANYVDAFTWKPGAVAYHLASAEADTLRRDSNVWCKRMLESGVGATLGPAYEPYLAAFPRPLDFFPLLLTGKLSLAEVYAATSPFNSWVMVLVGDPLYNPFKNSPRVDPADLPPILKAFMLRDQEQAPSTNSQR
jgi:uncharacterized protein (TIGR03790 family)